MKRKKKNKLKQLSNITRCKECGAVLPENRISAYCENCERYIQYDVDVLI